MRPGDHGAPENLIWATRGRSWGFRFLLDGGLPDPLPEYERHFASSVDAAEIWLRAAAGVALRFPDPLGRRDSAGRVIPHEFVVMGDLADGIHSVESGLDTIWPLVAGTYARIWEAEKAPTSADLCFTTSPPEPR